MSRSVDEVRYYHGRGYANASELDMIVVTLHWISIYCDWLAYYFSFSTASLYSFFSFSDISVHWSLVTPWLLSWPSCCEANMRTAVLHIHRSTSKCATVSSRRRFTCVSSTCASHSAARISWLAWSPTKGRPGRPRWTRVCGLVSFFLLFFSFFSLYLHGPVACQLFSPASLPSTESRALAASVLAGKRILTQRGASNPNPVFIYLFLLF